MDISSLKKLLTRPAPVSQEASSVVQTEIVEADLSTVSPELSGKGWIKYGAEGAIVPYGAMFYLSKDTQQWVCRTLGDDGTPDEFPVTGLIRNLLVADIRTGRVPGDKPGEAYFLDRVAPDVAFLHALPKVRGIGEDVDPLTYVNSRFGRFAERRRSTRSGWRPGGAGGYAPGAGG